MLDSYRSAQSEYQSYILRARHIRAQAFRTAPGLMAGAITAWLRTGFQRLRCWRIQYRAEQELQGLHRAVLKDIGVSRSEIPYRVREALPCS
jgi:uncharacterized protein YjiS (DUF1127 family)